MSEYWVSKKKYFCKYCDIYIADDVPSRQQHENGLRHKGNKDRFIRELYKTGEKRKKDKELEDREMKMVEQVRTRGVLWPLLQSSLTQSIQQAAQAAYAKDVGVAVAEAAVASSSKPKPPPPAAKASAGDRWANYTTAASLGIVDVEGEMYAAEAQLRQKEGRVGEWSTVPIAPPPLPVDPASEASSSSHAPKREREPTPPGDEEDTRRFKVRQKTVAVGLGADLYDPGEIKIKKRNGVDVEAVKKEEEITPASLVPEWRPLQLTRTGRQEKGPITTAQANAKLEEADPTTTNASVPPATDSVGQPSPDVKPEPIEEKPAVAAIEPSDNTGGGGLFKKRKMKSATAGGRRA